jgi:hypothetical protein
MQRDEKRARSGRSVYIRRTLGNKNHDARTAGAKS